jgi:hypothetical protein
MPPTMTAPVYLFEEGEMMIDAPVREVWPYVVDYSSWQAYSIVQHVSGKPGQEGEVVLLKKETSAQSTPYYARTIKLEPGRRVVWKTFRENVEYFGIVEFRTYESGGKTRFCYSLLYEHSVPYEKESELDEFRKQQTENLVTTTATRFAKLKELAEKSRAAK